MNDTLPGTIRSFFMGRPTQLSLNEALCVSCAKALVLAEKYGAISSTQFTNYSEEINGFLGLFDIVEWIKVLKIRYEFVDQHERPRTGSLIQLMFATVKRAERENLSPKSRTVVSDFSFLMREFDNLFFMLKGFRDYYQHNPDRDDLGWNTIVLSSIVRVLERATFVSVDKVNEREELKRTACDLLVACMDPGASKLGGKTSSPEDREITTLPQENRLEVIDQSLSALAQHQTDIQNSLAELLDVARAIDKKAHLSSANEGNNFLKREPQAVISTDRVVEELESAEDVSGDLFSDNEPPVELISPDTLRGELLNLRSDIAERFRAEPLLSAGSNLLQRQIISGILLHEPSSLDEMLQIPDVKNRYLRHKNIMDRQLEEFGTKITALFENTAWRKAE